LPRSALDESQLPLAFWLASVKFDPERACLRTFPDCVIASRMASAVRTERGGPEILPLLDSIIEPGIVPRATFDFRSDVASVLKRLDDSDRFVALALMEYSPEWSGPEDFRPRGGTSESAPIGCQSAGASGAVIFFVTFSARHSIYR
jgi:hypothetical protein